MWFSAMSLYCDRCLCFAYFSLNGHETGFMITNKTKVQTPTKNCLKAIWKTFKKVVRRSGKLFDIWVDFCQTSKFLAIFAKLNRIKTVPMFLTLSACYFISFVIVKQRKTDFSDKMGKLNRSGNCKSENYENISLVLLWKKNKKTTEHKSINHWSKRCRLPYMLWCSKKITSIHLLTFYDKNSLWIFFATTWMCWLKMET